MEGFEQPLSSATIANCLIAQSWITSYFVLTYRYHLICKKKKCTKPEITQCYELGSILDVKIVCFAIHNFKSRQNLKTIPCSAAFHFSLKPKDIYVICAFEAKHIFHWRKKSSMEKLGNFRDRKSLYLRKCVGEGLKRFCRIRIFLWCLKFKDQCWIDN